MARMPEAEWRGPLPSSNYRSGGMGAPVGVIIHHIDGSLAAADSTFHNPARGASAHFGVDFDGRIVQWVDTHDVAYAQCQGNWQSWVSIENASDHTDDNAPLTPAQIDANARIIAWLGTPAFPALSPRSGGVGYHRQFGGICAVHWGQTACPGDGIALQIDRVCKSVDGDLTPEPTRRKANDKMWIAWLLDSGWCDAYYNGVLVEGFTNNDHVNQFGVGQKLQGYLDRGAAFTMYKNGAEYAGTRDRLAKAAA
jgi:hypothetical protein